MSVYNRTKTAAKKKPQKPKGCVTFDFDRTLTLPHHDGQRYLYFGIEPNLPMIEKFKTFKAQGFTVGIVTSRPEEYERPGADVDGLGNKAIAVKDFIEKYKLPCDFVRYTHWTPKTPVLQELGSQLHHDDDYREIERCKDAGIPFEHIEHESDADHGY